MNELKETLKKLIDNKIVRGSTFVTTVNVFAGGLNFVFQLVASNVLGSTQYGIVYPLIALLTVITLISESVRYFVGKDIAVLIHHKHYADLKRYFQKIIKGVSIMGVMFAIVFILAIPTIMTFMNLPDATPLYFILISFLLNLASAPFIALMQSRERFGMTGFNNMIMVVVKFVVGISVVIITVNYLGALWGIVIGFLAYVVFGFVDFLRFGEFHKNQNHEITHQIFLKNSHLFKSFFLALLAVGSFQLLTQLDSLLVRQYLPDEAGVYSVVNLLGKASYFIATSLSFVLYPFMAKDKEKLHRNNALGLLVLLTALVAFATALSLFSPFIAHNLYHDKYAGMETLLPVYAFMFLPYAAITFLVNFYIISEKMFYSVVILIGTAVETLGIVFFHRNLLEVSFAVGFAGYLILAVLVTDSILLKFFQKRTKERKPFQ